MKITKADLISLITEVLEEDTDKFQNALETLRKKQQGYKVQSAVTLAQAQERESVASDTLDAAENRGEDVSKETESLNAAKESTKKARDGEAAAKNALKVAQGGGAPS
jgi:DNA-binding winged helix-turn-helix (wHTH) protein